MSTQLFTNLATPSAVEMLSSAENSSKRNSPVVEKVDTFGPRRSRTSSSRLSIVGDVRTSLFGTKPQKRESVPFTQQQPAQPPKLFAKLPQVVAESSLPKPEMMRLSAVYEMIETENDYVRDLQTMVQFHRQQLKESKLLGDHEVSTIFSNTEQLIIANQALAQRLLERKEQNPFISEIGDLIGEAAESLKVYTVYASNYPAAMKLVQQLQAKPEGKEFLTKLMNSTEARGLSLESFLIKPVQRICKYPLLIRELEKHSEKAGNAKDQANLKQASEKIEAVVMLVNEATRAAEERQRILNIETAIETPVPLGFADKKYLKDGNVLQMIQGKQKERFIVLFVDILLICKPLNPPKGNFKYELESGFSLPELILKQEMPSKATKNSIQLQIITSPEKQVLQFFTYTEEDKLQWLNMLQRCFKDITEEHRSAVRNTIIQQQGIARQSSLGDTFGLSLKKTRTQTPSGLSSTILRKQAQENRKTVLDLFTEDAVHEPETVEIGGQVYKRALSAIGLYYYACLQTKTAIWHLPEDFSVIDGTAAAEPETHPVEDPNQDQPNLSLVEGYPDWRKVDCDDGSAYFFNITTQQTQWEHPSEPQTQEAQ
ncbi:Dbl homology domain-containing protein [Gorgonomyces haynaldii]|nr:Dbl homology domain-containing protein [Gorgonomyces haynaldii]